VTLESGKAHRFTKGDRVVVIANPATRVNTRTVVTILERTVPDGVSLDLQWTRAPGGAKDLAAEALQAAVDGVIAVGGDGTVSDVASALLGTGMPLGVLPGGSTNIVAREHGVPKDMFEAARLIFGRHVLAPADVALCNERPFLHMAGAGFDSLFFNMTDPALKRRIGWMAYLPAAAQALLVQPATYRIEAEGEVITTESPMVLVANGASIITPMLKLSPDIRSDDGWLDLIVVTATKPHELASVLARFATLQFDKSPLVVHRRIRTLSLASSREIPVELDGDVQETTPATFGIVPAAIEFIVPARQWGH
jgi:diacylglycerol kinase (ATP)